jgi:hypothetical protein
VEAVACPVGSRLQQADRAVALQAL